MPLPIELRRDQKEIDEAVQRYLKGEQASVLAKYYKISKPGFYMWVQKYKKALLEAQERNPDGTLDESTVDKRVLLNEVQQLKLENRKLRDRVVSLMLKAGEM